MEISINLCGKMPKIQRTIFIYKDDVERYSRLIVKEKKIKVADLMHLVLEALDGEKQKATIQRIAD